MSQAVTKITKDTCGIFIEKGEKLQELVEELGMEIGIRGILSQEKINSDLVRGSVTSALEKYNEFEVNELEEPLEPKYISMQYFPGNSEVDPFSSTMAFIEKLTDIASLIMRFPDKKAILQQELSKINTLLPACVYIPFSNSKIRESFILHIPVQEAKVFITKERAPYLICVEVFRPYIEFQLSKNQTNSLPRRSQSESQNISITKSFCHADDTSFLKRTVEEAINPNSFRFPTKSLIIPTMSRPPSYSVADAGHYEKFRFTNNPVQSLGAIYEANEGTKSEDVIKSFKQQAERIRKASPYGSLKTWALVHLIVKSGDDLRQEQLAMQIISFFLQTFREKKLKLWLYAYDIIATGPNCGILECVPDAISLDALKKATERVTLLDHFNTQYGGEDSRELKKAKKEFMKSLAGYSLLCYILQIKDRHNGNILLDRNGHLIHIDFGFMLSNSPGGNMNFEKAPFKLTAEFESVLGGRRSNLFIKFRTACVKGYIALKEKADQIKLMVEMMRTGSGASLGCFSGGEQATNGILERLIPRTNMSERDCKQYINDLIDESLDNWSTRCYDKFQYCCQNIFY